MKNLLLIILAVILMRTVLLGNPFAWKFYSMALTQSEIGYREFDMISLNSAKYGAAQRPEQIDYLAVGTSQVGAIFSHWPDPRIKLSLFSVAGMKALDFILYRDEIFSKNPRTIILYLSELDLAMQPQPESLVLAPPQGLYLLDVYNKLSATRYWPVFRTKYLQMVIGEIFPEYKYSFVFKGLLKKVIGPKPAEAAWQVDWKVVENFRRALTADALEFNVRLLEDFIGDCLRQNIRVIILEGQYNPLAESRDTLKLNAEVVSVLRGLERKFAGVTFIPRDRLHVFQTKDYRDLSHVERGPAIIFNQHLRSLLHEQ